MKKFIPSFLKYPLAALYVSLKCLVRGTPGRDITLNMAGVLPTDTHAIVHGGKVKLLALRERFGDTWKGFNLAYFASSGLPFAPTAWIKIYKKFGVKVVWNQNGFAYPALYPAEVVRRVNSLFAPMRLADFIVYQTEFTKRCTEKFLGPMSVPSAILINPVDTEEFRPREATLSDESFVILMSGHHFESAERLRVSLEALREVRRRGVDAKLIVIANTQELPQEDWIEVVGKFRREEAAKLYHRGHLFLHLKSLDPCPNLILEALASGVPVVGLANGGMPELVDASSGILIPATEDFESFRYPSPQEVADAIMAAKNDIAALSRGARAKSLAFDKKTWVKKHEEIFNSLLT